MEDTEALFSAATAAFTAFDFDCLYLSEILSGLTSVSADFGNCAAGLGKLSKSFSDYAGVLSNQERFGHTQNYLTALSTVSGSLQKTTTTLGEQIAGVLKPLEAFLNTDVAAATKSKRSLAEAKARAGVTVLQRRSSGSLSRSSSSDSAKGKPQLPPAPAAVMARTTKPVDEATLAGLRDESKAAVAMLADLSLKARSQIVCATDTLHKSFGNYFESGVEVVQGLLDERIRQKEVQHASTQVAPQVAKEFNAQVLPKAMHELIAFERAHIARLEALAATMPRAKAHPRSAGFDQGEEELRLTYGPIEKALEVHKKLLPNIGEADSVSSVSQNYSTLLEALGDIYPPMIKTAYQACRAVAETPKKRSFFKSHLKETDFDTLRLCPLDYLEDLEYQFQNIVTVIGGAGPGYPALRRAIVQLKDLTEKTNAARESSQNAVYLMDINKSITGFEDLVDDCRKYLGRAEVSLVTEKENPKDKDKTKNTLFLFSDILALSSIPHKGPQVLTSKGRLIDLQFKDGSTPEELMVMWSSTAPDEISRIRFKTAAEKEQMVLNVGAACRVSRDAQVFGVELNVLMEREPNKAAPSVLLDALEYIMGTTKDIEGVFRMCGQAVALVKLYADIDVGKKPQYNHVHQAASVIKNWLRNLPTKLLEPRNTEWVDLGTQLVGKVADPGAAREVAKLMPPESFKVSAVLFIALQKIAQQSAINKMSEKNLAVVFAPSVLPIASDMPTVAHFSIVEELIRYADTIFAPLN